MKIDPNTRQTLNNFLADITPADGYCTHGPLTVTKLAEMLLEDVAMIATRPGCWEASNMAQVLSSHGYRV
jgi:hypothetical protein